MRVGGGYMADKEKAKKLLYELMVRTFVCMDKYEEEIGNNNRYLWIISEYERLVAVLAGISEEELDHIGDLACDLAREIKNDINGE